MVKNQSRRRIKCDISKPISRKFKIQAKKWHLAICSPFLFVTREEVPTLDSDLERKLERRLKTRQVEPVGDGGVVEGGVKNHQHQDCDLKQISI